MKKAVVLGGYGLIGAACLRALSAAGYAVTGVGRSRAAGPRIAPGADWIACDLARAGAAEWRRIVEGADIVVNASGALQDGARDDLSAIHERAVAGLVAALEGRGTRLIQISAAGVSDTAPTAFLRSKMRGDALIAASALDWVILRPGLVIGPDAYGGSALLRAAAALPFAYPPALAGSRVQTVALEDVAAAVLHAARGGVPPRTLADLAEPEGRSFAATLAALRAWQGLTPPRRPLPVPRPLLRLAAAGADALGWLGWRPPLRTTALQVLESGILADPGPWQAAGGAPCRPLEDTLAALPATTQERWFARLYLLLPLAVATLSAFWLASGLIGLARTEAAQAVLTDRGLSGALAFVAVTGGVVADIALGLAVLWRPWARAACLGMIALAVAYLGGATLLATDLWADPLGPLVKVLPAIALALVAAALLDNR